MKKDTETLILLGLLLWWLSRSTSTTSVNITSGGEEVMQTCYALGGFPYQVPVSSGPCTTA